ncbi:hypothetical protein DM47_2660 [Burkholderia mallei]|nr:hypothetical protein DM46_2416 [Burkholderia mallei]KOT02718.1 hypothetical protein DM50_3767 [Burkholderia mallei]KOT21223.1 hypothetical protein DM47_2660 [Burkholderia mallei]
MKHPQFRRHAHGDRAGHSPAPGVRGGRSRDVPRRYIKAPKRRYIDTPIHRYIDTSIRRPHVRRASMHPHVRAALRRHAVQCRQVDDEVSQLF